jgi:hypothetical protein
VFTQEFIEYTLVPMDIQQRIAQSVQLEPA